MKMKYYTHQKPVIKDENEVGDEKNSFWKENSWLKNSVPDVPDDKNINVGYTPNSWFVPDVPDVPDVYI